MGPDFPGEQVLGFLMLLVANRVGAGSCRGDEELQRPRVRVAGILRRHIEECRLDWVWSSSKTTQKMLNPCFERLSGEDLVEAVGSLVDDPFLA